MKTAFTILLLSLGIGSFQKISEINQHTHLAEISFKKGQYAAAVRHYEYVVFEGGQQKPELLLNLAHAYFKNNEPEKAQKIYTKCTKTQNQFIRSVAWENLGTIQTKLPDYKQALTFYKRAIVANPENEQARYNYELLKKYLRENPEKQDQLPPPAPEKKEKQEEKKPQPDQKEKSPQSAKPDANGNQENESKEQQDKGEQEQKKEKQTNPESNIPPKQEKPNGQNGQEKEQKQGEKKGKEEGKNLAENEEKPEPKKPNQKPGKETATGDEQRLQTQYDRLRKANISPEKANMMLEAIRNSEQQYLQQLPKKPTKKTDRSKPNW